MHHGIGDLIAIRALLAGTEPGVERPGDWLHIALPFENSFAGALALAG